MSTIFAVYRPAGDRPSEAQIGRVLLLFGLVAAGAAMALPVSTSLESAGQRLGDRDPLPPASATVGKPLALPFGDEVLTGNSNLDLLLEMQRAAPVTVAASRGGASAGPARSADRPMVVRAAMGAAPTRLSRQLSTSDWSFRGPKACFSSGSSSSSICCATTGHGCWARPRCWSRSGRSGRPSVGASDVLLRGLGIHQWIDGLQSALRALALAATMSAE